MPFTFRRLASSALMLCAAVMPLGAAQATTLPQLFQQDILLKSTYNRMYQAADSWYLWHNLQPNGFIDQYKQGVSGQLLFSRRFYLPAEQRFYDSSAEQDILPYVTTVHTFGQYLLVANSRGRITLFDAKGSHVPQTAELSAAFNRLDKVVALGNGRWLSLHGRYTPDRAWLQVWQQQADGSILPQQQQLQPGAYELLQLADKVVVMTETPAGTGELLELDANLQVIRSQPWRDRKGYTTYYAIDKNRFIKIENEGLDEAKMQLVGIAPQLDIKHNDTLQIRRLLSHNEQYIWFLNANHQFCRAELATLQQQTCEALPDSETTFWAGGQQNGLNIILGQHGLYLAGLQSGLRRQKSLAAPPAEYEANPQLVALAQLSSGQLISHSGLMIQSDTLAAGGSKPLRRLPIIERGCLPAAEQMPAQPIAQTLYQSDAQWHLAEQYQDCLAIFLVNAGEQPTLALQSTHPVPAGTRLYAQNQAGELIFRQQENLPSATRQYWRKKPQDSQPRLINGDLTNNGYDAKAKFFADKAGYLVLVDKAAGASVYQLGQDDAPTKWLGDIPGRLATIHQGYLYLSLAGQLQIWHISSSGLTLRYQLPTVIEGVQSLSAAGNELFVAQSAYQNNDITQLLVFDLTNPEQPAHKYQPYPFPLWSAGSAIRPWRFGEQLLVPLQVHGGLLQLQPSSTEPALPAVTSQLQAIEDTTLIHPLQLQNAEGWQLAVLEQPRHGRARLNGNILQLEPEVNFNGTDQLTLQFSRGEQHHVVVMAINVSPVNDSPQFVAATTSAVVAGQATSGRVSFQDVDGDALIYRVVSQTGLTPAGVITVDSSGTYRYQAPLQAGTETIRLEASDPHGAVATATFSITVTAASNVEQPAGDQTQRSGGAAGWLLVAMLTLLCCYRRRSVP